MSGEVTIVLTDAGTGDEIERWTSSRHTDYRVGDVIEVDDRLDATVTGRRWSGPYLLTLLLTEVTR